MVSISLHPEEGLNFAFQAIFQGFELLWFIIPCFGQSFPALVHHSLLCLSFPCPRTIPVIFRSAQDVSRAAGTTQGQ